jgi:hypothetical protein
MYSQADDNEMIDDYGGQWKNYTRSDVHKSGFPNLVKTGIATFFNFSVQIPTMKTRKKYSKNKTTDNQIFTTQSCFIPL